MTIGPEIAFYPNFNPKHFAFVRYYLSKDPQNFYDISVYDFKEPGIVPLIPPGYFLEINPQDDPPALRTIHTLNLPLTIKIKRHTTWYIHKSDHLAPVHNAFRHLKYNEQPINGYTLEEARYLGYTV